MVSDVAEVERALLALSPHDRAAVIHAGLRSLDDANDEEMGPPDVDSAWLAEIRRRVDEIENGDVTLVSGAESDARVDALLSELHQ